MTLPCSGSSRRWPPTRTALRICSSSSPPTKTKRWCGGWSRNLSAGAALITGLAHGLHRDVALSAVSNPVCLPHVVDEAAAYDEAEVRAAAADNPACSPRQIRRLAADTEAEVRTAVASNDACPSAVWWQLAYDLDPLVRNAAWRHPHADAVTAASPFS